MTALIERSTSRPDPLVEAVTEMVAGLPRQISFAGPQAVLTMAAMNAVRATTAYHITGGSWDRHLAEVALRDVQRAVDELAELLATPLAGVA